MSQLVWSVKKQQQICASRQKLWEIISSPSNLTLFHPFCKENRVKKWPGKNSRDVIQYYSGIVYERKFIKWKEKVGYDLIIGKKGGKKSSVSWTISKDKGKTYLAISIYPHLYNDKKNIRNFILFNFFVRRQISKYLGSVLKGLEFYINTNTKVKKNQFGRHKFFSK